MSHQATKAVLEHSKSRGGARLVLLAVAYHADKHGCNAYPSFKKLKEETKLGERQIRYHLTALERMGEITRDVKAGEGWANVYTILLPDMGVGQYTAPPEDQEVGQSTAGPANGWGNTLPQGGAISSRGVGQYTAPQESLRRDSEEIEDHPVERDLKPRARDPISISAFSQNRLSKEYFARGRAEPATNGAHSPPIRDPADIPTPMPLPPTFSLTPGRQRWAEHQVQEHGATLDVGLSFKKFCNYFGRGKGKSTELDDWEGRWERWVLDDIEKQGQAATTSAKGNGHATNNESRRAMAIKQRFRERTGAELDEVSFSRVGDEVGPDPGLPGQRRRLPPGPT